MFITTQALALQLASGLATMSGEFTLEFIARVTGVDQDTLSAWFAHKGRFIDDNTVSVHSLAEVWEAFADKSPTCAAMYEATQQKAA